MVHQLQLGDSAPAQPASGKSVFLEAYASLEQTSAEALACVKCGLCSARKSVVFADGSPQAKLMIIGEGPGTTGRRQRIAVCRKSRPTAG